MPLVEGGKRTFGSQVRLIVGLEVAVEIGYVVNGLAEGVIPKQAEMLAEALLHFDDAPVVEGFPGGLVHVVLEKQRIHKAGENSRPCARGRAVQRIVIPLPNGDVCGSGGHERRRQQILVARTSYFQCARVYVAERNREVPPQLTFDP